MNNNKIKDISYSLKKNNEKFVVCLDREFITKYAHLDESLLHIEKW